MGIADGRVDRWNHVYSHQSFTIFELSEFQLRHFYGIVGNVSYVTSQKRFFSIPHRFVIGFIYSLLIHWLFVSFVRTFLNIFMSIYKKKIIDPQKLRLLIAYLQNFYFLSMVGHSARIVCISFKTRPTVGVNTKKAN